MPTNAFSFKDPAGVRRVTSTELRELFEFGFNHAGTWPSSRRVTPLQTTRS
jgi:hypothetical protein